MQDWEAILRRGFESKELDYKGPCAWDEGDKKSCCEIVKDILAIANAKGGWIVIGVSEPPAGFSWDGLTDDQCKSFETSRLNRFVQNYFDPPINTCVIKHASQGRNFVVIQIPLGRRGFPAGEEEGQVPPARLYRKGRRQKPWDAVPRWSARAHN
jgi:predicted HTH transcriptional regulator